LRSLPSSVVVFAALLLASVGASAQVFRPPFPLNTTAATGSEHDRRPQVKTDGAGQWVAVWHSRDSLGGTIGADDDILVARSTDNGATWTGPAPLNTNAGTDSRPDSVQQVTTDRLGNWVVVWQSSDSLGGTIGTDTDILVAHSTDHGEAWTPPIPLNTNAENDSGYDAWPHVATDGAAHWVAVWQSSYLIGPDWDILVTRSTDHGATWTAPAALNTNAASDSGGDWQPHVTTDGAGHWVAVWYSYDSLGGTIGTDTDILVARSTDHGETWTDPAPLNSNAASDEWYDGAPRVTTDAAGHWVAVWESYDSLGGTIGTDGDILMARSTDNGATWTAPAPLNSNAAIDSGDDSRPQVTTDAANHWVAVWESDESLDGKLSEDSDILVARSTDNGTTWTAPISLNTNAEGDSGNDNVPQVTTDAAGHWVAVWESYESLGDTIGTDGDILVSIPEPQGSVALLCAVAGLALIAHKQRAV
jgi:hypothetical protein